MIRLLKNMGVYGLGGILNRTVQFLLLPVYTRVMSPAEYGSLELVYLTANVAALAYGLMISSGYVRLYFDKKDETFREQLLGSAFWFTTLMSVLVGGSAILMSKPLADTLFTFSGGATYIVFIAISDALAAHNRVMYNVLMVQQRATRYVLTNLSTVLLSLSLTVLFVVGMDWSVTGVLAAQLIAYTVEFILLAVAVLRRRTMQMSWHRVREMLSFSLPLIPLQLAAFVLSLADRFFLQHARSVSDVGLYALGAKFASIIPLLTVEPFKAFGPYIFDLIDQPERCKQVLANMTRYYMAGGMVLVLTMVLFAREAVMLVSDQSFHQAAAVVFPLALAQLLFGLFNVTAYGINIVKQNWLITGTWLVAAALNLGLNSILTPRYGMGGAALATVTSYGLACALNMVAVQRVYPLPLAWGPMLALVVMAGGAYAASWLQPENLLTAVGYKVALIGLFITGIVVTGYIKRGELAKLRDWYRERRQQGVPAEGPPHGDAPA